MSSTLSLSQPQLSVGEGFSDLPSASHRLTHCRSGRYFLIGLASKLLNLVRLWVSTTASHCCLQVESLLGTVVIFCLLNYDKTMHYAVFQRFQVILVCLPLWTNFAEPFHQLLSNPKIWNHLPWFSSILHQLEEVHISLEKFGSKNFKFPNPGGRAQEGTSIL